MKIAAHQGLNRSLGWGAAACWLASWFLPVMKTTRDGRHFARAVEGPFREKFRTPGEDAVPQVLSALTNVVFVCCSRTAAPGLTRPALFLQVAIACLLLNLYWLVQMLRAASTPVWLRGYYAWLLAFALLVVLGAISVVSARRTSKTPTGDTPA